MKASVLAYQHRIDVKPPASPARPPKSAPGTGRSTSVYSQEAEKTRFLLHQLFGVGNESGGLKHALSKWVTSQQSCQDIWASVKEHVDQSVMMQRVTSRSKLPNRLSTAVCLDLLGELSSVIPEHSRTFAVISKVLSSAIYTNPEEEPHLLRGNPFYREFAASAQVIAELKEKAKMWEEFQSVSSFEKACRIAGEVESRSKRQAMLSQFAEDALLPGDIDAPLLFKFFQDMPRAEKKAFQRLLLAEGSPETIGDHFELFQELAGEQLQAFVCKSPTLVDAAVGFAFGERREELPSIEESEPTVRAPIQRSLPMSRTSSFAMAKRRSSRQILPLNRMMSEKKVVFLQRTPSHSLWHKRSMDLAQLLWRSDRLLQDVLEHCPHLLSHIMHSHPQLTVDVLLSKPLLLTRLMVMIFGKSPEMLAEIAETNPGLLRNAFEFAPELLADIIAHSPKCAEAAVSHFCAVLGPLLCDEHPGDLAMFLARNPSKFGDVLEKDPSLINLALEANNKAAVEALQRLPSLLLETCEAKPRVFSSALSSSPELLGTILAGIPADTATLALSSLRSTVLADPVRLRSLELRPFFPIDGVADAGTQVDIGADIGTAASGKKINPLPFYVRKKRACPPRRLEDAVQYIGKIYASKTEADLIDDKHGHSRDSLPEAINDLFLQEFGVKTEAMKHLGSFMATVRRFESASVRIKLFGLLTGVLETEAFNPQAADVFLFLLRTVVDPEMIEGVFSSVVPFSVSQKAVEDAIRLLFPPATEGEDALIAIERVNALKSEGGEGADGVDVDDALLAVMMTWLDAQHREFEEYVQLFRRSDENGDGVLSYEEFRNMVSHVDPMCDQRSVLRMFKMCGTEDETGQHFITPDEFVQVMRAHKYSGKASALMARDRE